MKVRPLNDRVLVVRIEEKEKTLGKIEVNLVYIASPLSRETATFPEKIE